MSVVSKESSVVLRSPGSLAAALPGLVGFAPEQSLVVVYLNECHVVVTMRVDLPENLIEAAEHVAQTGVRAGASEALLVVCCDRVEGALPHAEGIAAISVACQEAGVEIKDALLVDQGRFWSYLCRDTSCCPPQGRAIPEDTSGLVAETVAAGRLAPAASREELVERFRARPDHAPSPKSQEAAQASCTGSQREVADRVWAAVVALATAGGVPGPEDQRLRALVQVGMQQIHVRDWVLTQVALAETGTDAFVDVVVRCALTAPDQWRPRVAAAAAALLAACGGHSVAVEAVLELAHGESLGFLVATSVRAAVPPQALRDVFAQAHPMVLERLESNTPE